MLSVRCYPLGDDRFRTHALKEIVRLGGNPQAEELELSLRSMWPQLTVVRVRQTRRSYDPILFVFRDGHTGNYNPDVRAERVN